MVRRQCHGRNLTIRLTAAPSSICAFPPSLRIGFVSQFLLSPDWVRFVIRPKPANRVRSVIFTPTRQGEFVPSNAPSPAIALRSALSRRPQIGFVSQFPPSSDWVRFVIRPRPANEFVSSSLPAREMGSFRHLYPTPQLPFDPRFPAARKLGLFRNFRHPRAGSVSSSVPGPPTGFVPSPLTQPPDRGSFRHFLHTQNWVRSVNLRYPRILPNSAPFSRRIRSVVAGSGSVLHSPRS